MDSQLRLVGSVYSSQLTKKPWIIHTILYGFWYVCNLLVHDFFSEIPLFHVLTARITFGNIFGVDDPKENVTTASKDDRLSCVIDESVFDPPSSYTTVGKLISMLWLTSWNVVWYHLYLGCLV